MARKIRFTEEQIVLISKDVEAGAKPADVCREAGITETTLDRWRSKYGGMEVADAKRLDTLEDENRRLKQLLADQLLDNEALRLVLGKNDPARSTARGGGSGSRAPVFQRA